MRRTYPFLLLLIWLASRCSHTHTVALDDHSPADSQAHGNQKRHAKVTDDERQAASPSPPLPASPAGLLREGAAVSIQDRLIARGYLRRDTRTEELDGPTEKALRDFQRASGLPATGVPDDLTVKKLGLSPGDLFRASPTGGGKR